MAPVTPKSKAPARVAREVKNPIRLRRYVIVLEPPVSGSTEPGDKYFIMMRDRSDAKPVRVLPSDLVDGWMIVELEKIRPAAYKLIHQRGSAVDDIEYVLMDAEPNGRVPVNAPAKKAAQRKEEPKPPSVDDDVLREAMSSYGGDEPDIVTKQSR